MATGTKTSSEIIAELETQMLQLQEQNETIQAQADADQRVLSEDEDKTTNANISEIERCMAEIDRRKKVMNQKAALSQPQNIVRPQMPASGTGVKPSARVEYLEGPKSAAGFRSFAEFTRSIIQASNGRGIDPRLIQNAAATTFGSEGTVADGGYALPADYRDQILSKVQGENSLFPLFSQYSTASNKITLTLDNTTAWQTSGGVLADWVAEGVAITQSKPALATLDLPTYKIAAIVPLTDELIQDSPSLNSWLPRKLGEKVASVLNAAVMSGTGSAQPLGILAGTAGTSNGRIVVTSAKVANVSVGWADVVTMYSRLNSQLINQSVWIIHSSVLPQLLNMTGPGSVPVWLPPSQSTYSAGVGGPAGTLLGRPVYISEASPALGTVGDIALVGTNTFAAVSKSDGPTTMTSAHIFFDAATTALRVTARYGFNTLYSAVITRKNGTDTYGNCIVLNATRS